MRRSAIPALALGTLSPFLFVGSATAAPVFHSVAYSGNVSAYTAATRTGLPSGRYAQVTGTQESRSGTNLVVKVDLYAIEKSNAYRVGTYNRTTTVSFSIGDPSHYGDNVIGTAKITSANQYPSISDVGCTHGAMSDNPTSSAWANGMREGVSYSGHYIVMYFPLAYLSKCGIAHGSVPISIWSAINVNFVNTPSQPANVPPNNTWGEWQSGELAEFRY